MPLQLPPSIGRFETTASLLQAESNEWDSEESSYSAQATEQASCVGQSGNLVCVVYTVFDDRRRLFPISHCWLRLFVSQNTSCNVNFRSLPTLKLSSLPKEMLLTREANIHLIWVSLLRRTLRVEHEMRLMCHVFWDCNFLLSIIAYRCDLERSGRSMPINTSIKCLFLDKHHIHHHQHLERVGITNCNLQV